MHRYIYLTFTNSFAQQAKYVFYFIGDGMGVNQVQGTELYRGELNGKIGIIPLQFTQFPYATVSTTFSATNGVTDSAAAGTALATGNKTKNGAIGVLKDLETPVNSVAVWAKEAGHRVGIATSVSVDHATPAAFYAHAAGRSSYYSIGKDLYRTGFDFYAGSDFLEPVDKSGKDTENLYDLAGKNGYCGNMSGVFKYPATLKPEAYQRLKHDLIAQSTGLHNAHTPLLLEGGMTYERISIPPEDAQFIATRKFQKTEVATIYGVPPHMIADLERATNNNIEHQGMEFVQYCLMSYITRLEEEFNRKLLRDDEYNEYYFLFSLNGLLRGDAKTRSEYYKNMNLVGAMSANEIRAFEDMNAYEGGDTYFVQANMQSVEKAINTEYDETE